MQSSNKEPAVEDPIRIPGDGTEDFGCGCGRDKYCFDCNGKTFTEVGPKCAQGYTWIENACYKFFSEVKAWKDAEIFCHGEGGHLAKIYSASQNLALQKLALKAAVNKAKPKPWIGLIQDDDNNKLEGAFKWSDGTSLSFTNWHKNEPNNRGGNEDCGVMYTADGSWNDVGCNIDEMVKSTDEDGFFCMINQGEIDHGCGCGKPLANCTGCDGVQGSEKIDHGCGCGKGKGCIGCDGKPNSGAKDFGCGCGYGKTCFGCDGKPNSGKRIDKCDQCGGSNACLDCAGKPNGGAVDNGCGCSKGKKCYGCDGQPNSGKKVDKCGLCGGDDTTCLDCAGVPRGQKKVDICNICGGDDSTCKDCDGIPNGGSKKDICGICGGTEYKSINCPGAAQSSTSESNNSGLIAGMTILALIIIIGGVLVFYKIRKGNWELGWSAAMGLKHNAEQYSNFEESEIDVQDGFENPAFEVDDKGTESLEMGEMGPKGGEQDLDHTYDMYDIEVEDNYI
eukprot:UC4_evm11s1341